MGSPLLKWMLPLLLAATPAWAEDRSTNAVPAALTVNVQAATPHLNSSAKLERTPDAAGAKAKKHWWTRFKLSFTGGPSGNRDEIIRYQGLSSRPWSAISADPPYMSNSQDLRVHHPGFGIGGSY
jgi:hypothetical protein